MKRGHKGLWHIPCNNVWVSKYPNLAYGTHRQKWIHFASLGKQLNVHNSNIYSLDLHTKAILGTSQVPVPFKGHCFSEADTHWDSLLTGTKGPALGQESVTDPRVGDINSPTLVFTSQCTGRKKETHRRIMHTIFRSGWEKWMNIYLQQIQRKEQRKRGTTERATCVDTELDSNNELYPFHGYIMGNKWQVHVQGAQDFKETLWLCYENSNELN